MVPYIVTESVKKKLRTQSSVLVGNYEYYYAVGLWAKRLGLSDGGTMPPADLERNVKDALSNFSYDKENPTESYLFYLIERYEADPDYDGIMKDLFQTGMSEADTL